MPVLSSTRVMDVNYNANLPGYQTNVQLYTYNGNTPQQWMIEGVRGASYPGAKPYVQMNTNQVNCQGYAFFTNNKPYDWFSDDDWIDCMNSTTANQMLAITKASMVGWLNANFNGKWVGSATVPTLDNNNQWIVAMKVGKERVYYYEEGYSRIEYDYHFWYRTYSGRWANKHGDANSEFLYNDTPSMNSSSGWVYGGYSPFYTSDVYYYKITQ